MYRPLFISCFFLFSLLGQSMGQTHVQTRALYQTSTASTISRAFSTASTSGNLIVVHVDWDGQTRVVNAVGDNKGNTYRRINGPTNWNGTDYRAELWYAYNIQGEGDPVIVTATLSGGATTYSQIYITEYSGIVTFDPLDQNAVSIGNTAAVSSGSRNVTYTNELVYGAAIGSSALLTKGAGFTSRSTAKSNVIEDKKATSAGSYDVSFSSDGGNWVAQMATFITINSLAILPVELLSFTGRSDKSSIELNWTTTRERNNDYFAVERSEDAMTWQPVGIVKHDSSNTSIHQYSFTTKQSIGEFSYFRLKQVDLDGRFKYSQVLKMRNASEVSGDVRIFPNPTKGTTLSGRVKANGGKDYGVTIFDKSGRIIGSYSFAYPDFTINFSRTLPVGVYYAKVSSTNYSSSSMFLVQ